MRHTRILLGLFLALSMLPGADAAPSITENDDTTTRFEDFSESTGPTDFGETLGTPNMGTANVLSEQLAYFADTQAAAGVGSSARYLGAGQWNLCSGGGTIEFDLILPTSASVTNGAAFFGATDATTALFRFQQVSGSMFVGLKVLWDGTNFDLYWAGAGTSTFDSGTLASFQDVAGGTELSVLITVTEISANTCGDPLLLVISDTAIQSKSITTNTQYAPLYTFIASTDGAAGTTDVQGVFLIDNVTINAETPSVVDWCSSPSSDNFDYDFKEDVVRDTVQVGMTIDPFYSFEGDSDNYGYLGKSWGGTQSTPTTGSTHMQSHFTIESATDGADSNLRSSFTFIRATGTPTVPIMDKGTGTTAGDSSGDFAEHIEARFWEQGNDWDIRFFTVSVANGVTTRTQVGGNALTGDPNSPNSFIFDVDTVAGTLKVIRGTDDVLLLQTDLPSYFDNDAMYGHYFVGFNTDLPVIETVRIQTGLDEDARNNRSTCLIDMNGGTSFNGASGLNTDFLEIPEEEEPVDTDAEAGGVLSVGILPDGWTVAAFNGFLGVVVMGAITAGFYFTLGRSVIAALIGAGAGFFLAYFLGLFALWIVVVVAVIAAAIIFVRIRGTLASGA